MKLRMVFVSVAALAAGLAMLAPSESSFAAGAPAKQPKAVADAGPKTEVDSYDPDNRLHISRFMEAVALGNAKATSRDFAGAMEQYRKGIQLQPANPLGHYLLAEAQLVQGNLSEAEASMNQAENVADKAPSVKAKVLFVLAELKERQKKWDEAKTAWRRYEEYAGNHSDAAAMPASAAARIAAIDEQLKQDDAYAVVRERIATERDGGTWSPKDSGK